MALAILILALGGVSAWDRALLRGASSPRVVEIPSSGAAVVVLADGKRQAMRAVGGIGVTRYWVALAPLSLAGRSVLVTAGMLGASGARLLRLWALWGRTPGVVAGQRQAWPRTAP
jgi:hypothetical protein